jgi:hypothetical protein
VLPAATNIRAVSAALTATCKGFGRFGTSGSGK